MNSQTPATRITQRRLRVATILPLLVKARPSSPSSSSFFKRGDERGASCLWLYRRFTIICACRAARSLLTARPPYRRLVSINRRRLELSKSLRTFHCYAARPKTRIKSCRRDVSMYRGAFRYSQSAPPRIATVLTVEDRVIASMGSFRVKSIWQLGRSKWSRSPWHTCRERTREIITRNQVGRRVGAVKILCENCVSVISCIIHGENIPARISIRISEKIAAKRSQMLGRSSQITVDLLAEPCLFVLLSFFLSEI